MSARLKMDRIHADWKINKERIVKQESEEDDNIVTVSTTIHTTNRSLDASTDDKQADDTEDFADFCVEIGESGVKSEVKL